MRKALLIVFAVLILISCHRHTAPATTTTNTPSNPASTGLYNKPIIIVDAHGNIVATATDLPPNADKTILNPENARAYTPEQTKKLAYRFKYIPPKILYVPASLSKTINRGTYYVYKNKFWYWKKPNGYYYLDETYYN
jgi:hypothetical protein